MRKLRAVHTRPISNSIFIPTDLKSCSQIFLCHDTVRKSLQPIFDGPFLVLQRSEETSTTLQNDKKICCYCRSLKPYLSIQTYF
ncbi:unnamed protein product [Hymenolepis diminuta]|uniref:Uncharacterized protein n=1 Tax=Hymenolepis diminuta TaxID=6216 RepID=A0A564XV72_HYMDI|nr:unnamed protein product [Hymenolepis diminuta]